LQSKFDQQLSGFAKCLTLWYEKSFHRVVDPAILLAYFKKMNFFEEYVSDLPLLVKYFKFILCWNFSKYMSQEQPEGDFKCINIYHLFPTVYQPFIKSRLIEKRPRKLVTLWDLLQCKTLSHRVPKDFITKAYIRHHEVMSSRCEELPISLLDEIREFCRPYCKAVVNCYEDKTIMPSNHATYTSKRSDGGLKYDLKGRLINRNVRRIPNREQRLDPIVIHLEGLPGARKSFSVRSIAEKIIKAFGMSTRDFDSLVYTRSGATKHWDGYNGQFITIIDDFAYMESSGNRQKDDPTAELISLCSTVDYVLPMAKLEEKGRKFRSEFLILTSNQATACTMTKGLACPAAYFRRLSPTYKYCPSNDLYGKKTYHVVPSSYSEFGTDHSFWSGYDTTTQRYITGTLNVSDIVRESLMRWDNAFQNQDKSWMQTISDHPENPLALQFPATPPTGLSKAMAFAVPEPLKVRMITKPQFETFALKPLSRAMLKALKSYECFEPCHNPDYDLKHLGKMTNESYLLSGDYTAATDELNFHASQAVLDVLCEELEDRYPVVAEWCKWEGSHHLIEYPPITGLSPVVQSCGQLMGSLLSFPILSILNAFTMCKATGQSLKTVPALFHGDDIAARVTLTEYENWKQNAKSIGLQLSLGKNYLSKNWVSIDSQIFCLPQTADCCSLCEKKLTGKFKLVCRSINDIPTCRKALENRFRKSTIVRYTESLKQTPRSLDVSTYYGGLGIENSKITDTDKLIYIHDLEKIAKVRELYPGYFSVPKELAKMLSNKSEQYPVPKEEKELEEGENEKSLKRFLRKKNRYVKTESFKLMNLNKVRPLFRERVIIHCVDYTLNELNVLSRSVLGTFSKQSFVNKNVKVFSEDKAFLTKPRESFVPKPSPLLSQVDTQGAKMFARRDRYCLLPDAIFPSMVIQRSGTKTPNSQFYKPYSVGFDVAAAMSKL